MKKEDGLVFGPRGIFKVGIQHWVGCSSCDWKFFALRNILPHAYWLTENTWSLNWIVFFLAYRKARLITKPR